MTTVFADAADLREEEEILSMKIQFLSRPWRKARENFPPKIYASNV